MTTETILAYVLAGILFGGFFLILRKLREVGKLAEANVKYIEEELHKRTEKCQEE